MNKTTLYCVIAVVATVAAIYFAWPKLRKGFAWSKSAFNKQRSFVVDGTAHSGNDSGGVLTSACN